MLSGDMGICGCNMGVCWQSDLAESWVMSQRRFCEEYDKVRYSPVTACQRWSCVFRHTRKDSTKGICGRGSILSDPLAIVWAMGPA